MRFAISFLSLLLVALMLPVSVAASPQEVPVETHAPSEVAEESEITVASVEVAEAPAATRTAVREGSRGLSAMRTAPPTRPPR